MLQTISQFVAQFLFLLQLVLAKKATYEIGPGIDRDWILNRDRIGRDQSSNPGIRDAGSGFCKVILKFKINYYYILIYFVNKIYTPV